MQIYIVAILISLLLIAILFFALRSTVKRIDYNTKKYFVDKLQDYDYLIDEKKNILNELNKKIEENKKELEELKKIDKIEHKEKSEKYYANLSIPKYEDQSLFKKYKNIKEKFNFNYEKIIKDFISNKLTPDVIDYNISLKIRKKFTDEIIYKILGLKLEQQYTYIKDILTEEEFIFINKSFNIKKLKINKFLVELDLYIEKNDPIVYIYIGQKNKNYNYISEKIKTIYDKNINEGIKIIYKGNVYDYSI